MNRASADVAEAPLVGVASWSLVRPVWLTARLIAAALFGLSMVVYVATRSISLDDWDSVNFARAIDYFDVTWQQPHPPGYPAYVFFARLLNLATHDPLTSLTLLSALSGAFCLLAVYVLAADFGAAWAALPLAVMPLFWFNSEMALSDVPGLAFAAGAVWLLHRATIAPAAGRWWESRRWYLLTAAATAGVGAGVRPQDAIIPLAVAACYTLPLLVRERNRSLRHDLLLSGGVFVATCLAWGIPLLHSFQNRDDGIEAFKWQAQYVKGWDSLVAYGAVTPDVVRSRVADFGSAFSSYFGGPQDGGLVAFCALAAALATLAIIARRSRACWLALVWLGSYGMFMLLVMQPADPRKILPAIPPMFLLLGAAGTATGLKGLRTAAIAACTILVIVFTAKSAPLIRVLDTTLTPPEPAAAYIGSHFPADDTLILAGASDNHIVYRLPDYQSYGVDFLDQDGLDSELASKDYQYLLILDKDGPGVPDRYVLEDEVLFERDSLLDPKGARVPLRVYSLSEVKADSAASQSDQPPG
ncbi:MAG TPA: glycosyltransferase family 39 protein [Chloroflexota bacterium]|nr:glycosyltransferase family 39 protein [Chloroflexota bacterium]